MRKGPVHLSAVRIDAVDGAVEGSGINRVIDDNGSADDVGDQLLGPLLLASLQVEGRQLIPPLSDSGPSVSKIPTVTSRLITGALPS